MLQGFPGSVTLCKSVFYYHYGCLDKNSLIVIADSASMTTDNETEVIHKGPYLEENPSVT